MAKKTKTLNLKAHEAHHASICVAIVWGIVAGIIASFNPILELIASFTPILKEYGIYIAVILGFCIPWVVCKYTFTSAHQWYKPKSWSHRGYDMVGIVAAVSIYWLHNSN